MDQTVRGDGSAPACFICGGQQFERLLSVRIPRDPDREHWIERCQSCDAVRSRPLLSDEELGALYTTQYYGPPKRRSVTLIEKLRVMAMRNRARMLTRIARAHLPASSGRPRVLDIGCGRGNLLVGLNQEGWDCWGLERPEFVDPSATAYKLLLSPQEVEALEDGSFDLVVMWHSLEHMSDPAATVALATRLLKPGGLLTIAVPNFDSTQRRWFGRHWFAMSVPVHRQHLSRRPLERLLTPHYDVLRFSTMALEQGTFIFAHSVVNALTDSHEPNPLYERLSLRQPGSAGMLSLVLQGVALLAALPVGFVESLVSGWLDRGTVLTLVAQKRRES